MALERSPLEVGRSGCPGRPSMTQPFPSGFARCIVVSLLGSTLACSGTDIERSQQIAARVIYGEDDRVDAYTLEDDSLRELALNSAVAMIAESALEPSAAGGFVVNADSLRKSANVCASERFAEQPAAARCSGVLVDDALVLTAGHCAVKIATCAEQIWVFDYALSAAHTLGPIRAEDVYRCKSIPFSVNRLDSQGRRYDFAFVELDRPTSLPQRPVRFTTRDVARGDSLTVVGYPSGLPVKIDRGASALDPRESTRDYFTLDSDTFDRSSGSGVFDVSGQLAGVLVRGGQDYDYDREQDCFFPRRIAQADPASAEQASYAARAAACLCSAGWDSQRLCPPGGLVGLFTDDSSCEAELPMGSSASVPLGGCQFAASSNDFWPSGPIWLGLFCGCWLGRLSLRARQRPVSSGVEHG